MEKQISVTTQRFRTLVDKQRLTREELAKEIECDTSLITKYYNGDREIPVKNIIKIAKHFHVSADYLLGLSDYPTHENSNIGKKTGLDDFSIEWLKKENSKKNNNLQALNILFKLPSFPGLISSVESLLDDTLFSFLDGHTILLSEKEDVLNQYKIELAGMGLSIVQADEYLNFKEYRIAKEFEKILDEIIDIKNHNAKTDIDYYIKVKLSEKRDDTNADNN